MRVRNVTKIRTDVAILGAGFAGSLLALMLSRQREVVLIERGRHPRFMLGESSTPLADLAIQEIARDYGLPWLAPLAKYGSWKRTYPKLPCGLKRGFTFAKHHKGQPFVPDPEHRNELLVSASPTDESADTQWLRADFDHFLVTKVVEAGIPYFDRTELNRIEQAERWHLSGRREGEEIAIEADFVVDASGASGALARSLNLPSAELQTNSWAVFSHFDDVERWQDVAADLGGRVDEYPYHADDAAMHHVLEDGWMYVLRFESGLVSAGFLLDGRRRQPDPSLTPAQEWERLLAEYPTVARQFRRARPVRPIERTGRLQRFIPQCAGDNWALLAPAAYTMDALFSTGNAHALLSVQRLARILLQDAAPEEELFRYRSALADEVRFIDTLVHGAYETMRQFPLFVTWSLYYFAGAIASEEARRAGAGSGEGFLSSDKATLARGVARTYYQIMTQPAGEAFSEAQLADFAERFRRDVAPINTTSLGDPAKRNLYPY
jgi:tetracycline 7-halogenase / FADH2 O2-dependent halogenase